MRKRTIVERCVVAGIILTTIFGICESYQPPYQVSIFVQLHPKGPPIRLCTGDIIQGKLILTTAGCVHYVLLPDKPSIPIHPSMLIVVAGSTNAIKDPLTMKVDDILIHPNFNRTTLQNDIALLRLTEFLPLGERDDVKWIILDEFRTEDEPCLANFHVRNSKQKIPDYTQTEELEFYEKEDCLSQYGYPQARRQDICSNYILPKNMLCDNLQKFIQYSGDRGSGLICKSRVIGLLSVILPPETITNNDCSERSVKAIYTDIGSYIGWVYDIIAEEVESSLPEDYSASAPFDQEMEAFIVSHISDSAVYDSPTTTTTPTTPTISEVQPLHRNAAVNVKIYSFGLIALQILINFS